MTVTSKRTVTLSRHQRTVPGCLTDVSLYTKGTPKGRESPVFRRPVRPIRRGADDLSPSGEGQSETDPEFRRESLDIHNDGLFPFGVDHYVREP